MGNSLKLFFSLFFVFQEIPHPHSICVCANSRKFFFSFTNSVQLLMAQRRIDQLKRKALSFLNFKEKKGIIGY